MDETAMTITITDAETGEVTESMAHLIESAEDLRRLLESAGLSPTDPF